MQATSGLGAAAAYALSKEGFCVVLGIAILPFSSIPFIYFCLKFWADWSSLAKMLLSMFLLREKYNLMMSNHNDTHIG